MHNPNVPVSYDYNRGTIEVTHLILGLLIAIAVYVVFACQTQPVYIQSVGETAARLANTVMTVSARLVGGGDCVYMDPSVASQLANASTCKHLNPCTGGACADYTKLSDEDKVHHGEAVKRYIKQHPDAVILAWAPWCPHCHAAMPTFIEASAQSGIAFAMFNAELVPREMLSGQSGTFPKVTHFPFICKPSTGEVYQGRVDQEGLVEFARGAPSSDMATPDDDHDLNAAFL